MKGDFVKKFIYEIGQPKIMSVPCYIVMIMGFIDKNLKNVHIAFLKEIMKKTNNFVLSSVKLTFFRTVI